ncbi:FAD-dependent oxidoreductase [Saccharopolyspora sp. CA-218241]|uniref:FAD-dependent oxidoreductase n=1 Tax=Saccharopolyspora sp. CA-218241 TaxID=3240027 RepID=UPI003D98E96E
MTRVVVVGGGPAAHRLVAGLRAGGFDGAVAVLGAEPRPGYHRVLLGSVVDGTLRGADLALPAPAAEVHAGAIAAELDRDRRVVRTASGDEHPYDVLVLATGARARQPELPGATPDRVRPLRTLPDATWLAAGAGPVAVLGGGVLGVETAVALRARGLDVTLVHPGPGLMDRLLDATAGRLLADRLGQLGVDLALRRRAVGHRPGELLLDDGTAVPAERVVVCAGTAAEVGLAERAGLAVRRGVVVDDELRTADPRIRALGDCAEHAGVLTGQLEPAWRQADVLAGLLTGADQRYRPGREMTRLRARGIDLVSLGPAERRADPAAEVVALSDPARGRYATVTVHDERITGGVLLGFPRAIAALTQLHDRGLPLPADRLALLLGGPAATGTATTGTATTGTGRVTAPPVLCHCNAVTRDALVAAWRSGARSVAELARTTRATTGCGGCTEEVARLCDRLRDHDGIEEGAA